MEMVFDFQPDEVAAVARAVRLHMQKLARQPTPENVATAQVLAHFCHKMAKVSLRGMAEESDNIGRLN